MKTMICLDNISYSEFGNEIASEINRYVEFANDEICVVAMDQTYPFTDINTAIFHPSEIDSFNNGVIIASSIHNAQSILSASNSSRKVLYLYDLDWMFGTMVYDDLYEILNDNNLTLILRSEEHIAPVRRLCGKKEIRVLENFSLEGIWNLL